MSANEDDRMIDLSAAVLNETLAADAASVDPKPLRCESPPEGAVRRKPMQYPDAFEGSDEDDDHSWMDVHTLNHVPPKNVRPIQITVRNLGRGKPMPHPGIWDDDE